MPHCRCGRDGEPHDPSFTKKGRRRGRLAPWSACTHRMQHPSRREEGDRERRQGNSSDAQAAIAWWCRRPLRDCNREVPCVHHRNKGQGCDLTHSSTGHLHDQYQRCPLVLDDALSTVVRLLLAVFICRARVSYAFGFTIR